MAVSWLTVPSGRDETVADTKQTLYTAELVSRVRDEFGLSEAEAERIVLFVFDRIAEALRSGRRVTLTRYFSLERVFRKGAERKNFFGRGAAVSVGDRYRVRIRAGSRLLRMLNAGAGDPARR